ncbi:MAG: apolipoprotein N-acyltransferase, partial [Nitrospirae bacterium]|nr:apolipoprotein N-acyltransferase [Nitrospirota bacterium]
GFLLVLSFPRMGLFPLAWIALVPLLIFLYDKNSKTAFKAGFFFGLVYFFGTLYWIYHSIHFYGGVPLVPSLLLVFVLCMYLSLYPALFAVLYASNIKRTDMPALFIAPLIWTTLEFLRSYMLSGFPWSSLGYSQYEFLAIIQIADITGVYGVSFLIVAVNGAVVDMLFLKRRYKERPLASFLPMTSGFVVLALVVVLTLSYGLFRLQQQRPGSVIKASVIQGNIEQDKKWDPAYQQSVTDTFKDLSFSAARDKPDLIVWPETAVPFLFRTDKERSDYMVSLQRQFDSYLLFGSVMSKNRKEKPAPTENKYANSAVLLDKNGNITYIYDKIHLVPFGEFVPLRHLLSFVDLTGDIGDYVRGESYTKAVTPFGSFGTLICYEIIFPGLVRKFYVKGGDFIVTITNDAWFGKTPGPYQHFSMAVFRAIENRKPVIRCANTGVSGFIDSCGRILGKTEIFSRTYLTSDIRTDKTLSPYTKYGDIFPYLSIVGPLLLLIRKRSRY